MPVIPEGADLVLGKMFDSEAAELLGVHWQKAREWRLALGIEPVCKACYNAKKKGYENRCPVHAKPPPDLPDNQRASLGLGATEKRIEELDRRRDAAAVRIKALTRHLVWGEPLPDWLDKEIRPYRNRSERVLLLLAEDGDRDAALEIRIRSEQ